MIVVPFVAEHLGLLNVQPAQRDSVGLLEGKAIEAVGSQSVFHKGKLLACAGVIEVLPHRALAWSFLSEDAGEHFVGLHRTVRRFLDGLPYRRLEAEVDCGFEQGHRWVRLLGFTCEAPRLLAYGADGRDMALYAKVK